MVIKLTRVLSADEREWTTDRIYLRTEDIVEVSGCMETTNSNSIELEAKVKPTFNWKLKPKSSILLKSGRTLIVHEDADFVGKCMVAGDFHERRELYGKILIEEKEKSQSES